MTQNDLPTIRRLAQNGAFSVSGHAIDQMLARNITYADLESILTSPANQIIECQSRSMTPGKQHSDERILIYDPKYAKDTIVIFVVLTAPVPDLRIITVENVDYTIWERREGAVPCLVRK